MLAPKAYSVLVATVEAIHSDASADDIVRAVVGWVGRHPQTFEKAPFSEYGFSLIAALLGRVDHYRATQLDDQAVGQIKWWVSRLKRSDSAGIAQYIRDLMEDLLAPETES